MGDGGGRRFTIKISKNCLHLGLESVFPTGLRVRPTSDVLCRLVLDLGQA